MKRLLRSAWWVCLGILAFASYQYSVASLGYEPIDVVIPCHEKDIRTLDHAIDGIRKFGKNVRRIITVSAKKITDKAEWFDEKNYPFTKNNVLITLFNNDSAAAADYLRQPLCRLGWIYQQFLKLYAPFVIPDISKNVLILDADTIFLKEVEFIDAEGNALFNVGTEYNVAYFDHAKKLLSPPNQITKLYREYSGITNHMLFQRGILEDLFGLIAKEHQMEPWRVMCKCIDPKEFSGISEFEIYFNFAFARRYKVKIRKLRYDNMKFNEWNIARHQREGYDYVSCHAYNG